jgi:glycerol-3-phosphate dehydrogenase (NAD(P)+)
MLGAGSWGTTLAVLLADAGHEVSLWGHDRAHLVEITADRENRKFLPGIALPDRIKVQPELEAALGGAEFGWFVVPSQAVREVARQAARHGGRGITWVCASKGLELGSLERLSVIIAGALGVPAPVVLTGPSHAEEVSRGIPTSVVAACDDGEKARAVQTLCATDRFRVYTNDDVPGCEYGAALKNVIAIAAGVCDGIGFGDNTKGALLTRGLAEMARLGVAMGGRRETFFGLTGLGDLIATGMSRHSRNRRVGEELGRGKTLDEVLAGMVMIAEGIHTARAARDLGHAHGVELPITDQVCALLFEGRRPEVAMRALMGRDLKAESG